MLYVVAALRKELNTNDTLEVHEGITGGGKRRQDGRREEEKKRRREEEKKLQRT